MATLNQVVTQVQVYDANRSLTPLRTLRVLSALSARELARLADIDRSTVRRLEAGVGFPQPRTARKIAAVLNCPVDLLFPHNDEEVAGQRPLATTPAGQGRCAGP